MSRVYGTDAEYALTSIKHATHPGPGTVDVDISAIRQGRESSHVHVDRVEPGSPPRVATVVDAMSGSTVECRPAETATDGGLVATAATPLHRHDQWVTVMGSGRDGVQRCGAGSR
jgi:hypothetical protein